MKVYLVKCDKIKGKFTTVYKFYSRKTAVRALNIVVLDQGKIDAVLRTAKEEVMS